MEQQPVGDQSLGSRRLDSSAFGLASIAAENARFMSRVYGWMTGGRCLTGAVAWNVAGNPDLARTIFGNRLLFWSLIIAQLGAVLALSNFAPNTMLCYLKQVTYFAQHFGRSPERLGPRRSAA